MWGLQDGEFTEFKSQKGKTPPKIVTLKRGRKIDEEWLQEDIRLQAAGKQHYEKASFERHQEKIYFI